MINAFHVIIPARYHSSRLPKKVLLEIHGISILERVYNQALKSNAASITIATDHLDILDLAKSFGADAVLTSSTHKSGTDRIAEVIKQKRFSSDDIIVNVQGDEPFIPPALIDQVAFCLVQQKEISIATLCTEITKLEEALNSNVVKVVRNHANEALYFSRSLIPFNRNEPLSYQYVFKHIGLYAYRAKFLSDIVQLPKSVLEELELLEQLRILDAGYKILVEEACVRPQQDINTHEDLALARHKLDNK